jgi:hypothetical protein
VLKKNLLHFQVFHQKLEEEMACSYTQSNFAHQGTQRIIWALVGVLVTTPYPIEITAQVLEEKGSIEVGKMEFNGLTISGGH